MATNNALLDEVVAIGPVMVYQQPPSSFTGVESEPTATAEQVVLISPVMVYAQPPSSGAAPANDPGAVANQVVNVAPVMVYKQPNPRNKNFVPAAAQPSTTTYVQPPVLSVTTVTVPGFPGTTSP
jgi:hypothetical protein